MQRIFVVSIFVAGLNSLIAMSTLAAGDEQEPPIDIGSRRELFVDGVLVQRLLGQARQVLQHPTPREIVLICDRPWEGNGVNYVTVFFRSTIPVRLAGVFASASRMATGIQWPGFRSTNVLGFTAIR